MFIVLWLWISLKGMRNMDFKYDGNVLLRNIKINLY